jgi:nanoRNase/pAp phosphatase (c-di-AMP/oligoRNAs hydrolase)
MDFAMFIAMDRKTASYRSVKDGVNVRNVAVYFGGKGHDTAATNPISDEKFREFLATLI